MQSDNEYSEALITCYKVLSHPGDDGMTEQQAIELLAIAMILAKRGFTQTTDEED